MSPFLQYLSLESLLWNGESVIGRGACHQDEPENQSLAAQQPTFRVYSMTVSYGRGPSGHSSLKGNDDDAD